MYACPNRSRPGEFIPGEFIGLRGGAMTKRGATDKASPLKTALILSGVIGGTIAFAVLFLVYMVPDTGDTTLSGHGSIALTLGIVFSIVVGVALMTLVFWSHRHGHDENRARRDTRDRRS